ncbi:MAG: LytR/AlgR family response regulator transcription factor, partial [Flammeovirgaceae bacterium]
AENGKLELEISAHSLLFLKTAGNYIDIHYQLNHQHQTYVLRNRLKNILPILNQPNFYQCHRSYLVNLDKVTQVTGNARGLELHLEGFDKQLIPVSRSKSQELEKLLHALK